MATAKTSDFITTVRMTEKAFMDAFARFRALEHRGRTTGMLVVDPLNLEVSSNLTQEDFEGENAAVTLEDLETSWGALTKAALSVTDEETAAIYRSMA